MMGSDLVTEKMTISDFLHDQIGTEFKLSLTAQKDLEKNEGHGESQFFWSFAKKLNLKMGPEFFEDFDVNDSFQLIDQYGRLTYFSFSIARLLKFDMDHVLNTPFDELFQRDPFTEKRIMEKFMSIVESPQLSVFDLTDIPVHVVQQKGFPLDSYSVALKKAYRVYQGNGQPYGLILRLDVKLLQN